MKKDGLILEKEHLIRLLEAVQRCVFFLDYCESALNVQPEASEFSEVFQRVTEIFRDK